MFRDCLHVYSIYIIFCSVKSLVCRYASVQFLLPNNHLWAKIEPKNSVTKNSENCFVFSVKLQWNFIAILIKSRSPGPLGWQPLLTRSASANWTRARQKDAPERWEAFCYRNPEYRKHNYMIILYHYNHYYIIIIILLI